MKSSSPLYEFSENTRKALLRAMKGRKRTQAFFDKSVTKWTKPTLFYSISVQAMEEIFYELDMAGIKTKDLRRDMRGPGYFANHPRVMSAGKDTIFLGGYPSDQTQQPSDQSTGPAGCNFDPNPRCLKCTRCGNDECNRGES